jgi:parvulin-like peptidyl-prolyl isomerase
VQHRDAGTGILLDDAGIGRANARLADIKARLRPDGSNFEEVALRSDDQRTAKDGGRLGGLHRYDDRMPATLCRAAWSLRDGEVSEPIESQYGWHILKRLEFNQNVLILFTDDAIPTIRKVMRRAMQEERLFAARKQTGLRLML